MRVHAFVLVQWLDWYSPPNTGTHDLPRQYSRFRSDDRAFLHARVIAESHLSANHGVVFDHDTAADSRLRRNHDALANVAVVPDVDHVVELRSTPDACAAQRRA